MPKLRHFDHLGTARFVTFSCFGRQPLLVDPTARSIVIQELARLRSDHGCKLLGYVVMPEHVHLLVLPPDDLKLGPAIGVFKKRSSHVILSRFRSDGCDAMTLERRSSGDAAVWQRRCYDHNCRSTATVLEKLKYCHDNPVKRGLVLRPEDWLWSSCRWYLGYREVELEIDGTDTQECANKADI